MPRARTGPIAAALTLLTAAALAAAQRPTLIEITGAVWAAADAQAIIDAADDATNAEADEPARIVLHFKTPDIRDDLAFQLLDWITRSKAETLVYLDDNRTQPTASTLLAIALASDHAAVAPKAVFSRAADRTSRALAPEPPSWGTVELDINRLAQTALADRERAPEAVHLIGVPREPAWLTADGKLVTEQPEAPAQQLAFVDPNERFQVVVPPGLATLLIDLRLHRSATGAIRDLGWPTPRDRVRIDADLAPRYEKLGVAVVETRMQAAEAEFALDPDLYRRGNEPVRGWHHQQAIARAAPIADRARGSLREATELAQTYPELLRLPVPEGFDGAAELSDDPADRARAWTRLMTELERTLNDLSEDLEAARRDARSP